MRARWFTPRALLAHLAVMIVAPGCLIAGWWQMTVALSGNDLSFVYTVEWPVFAVIAIVMWWQLVHEDPEQLEDRRRQRRAAKESHSNARASTERTAFQPDPGDEELIAYNRYLASLGAGGKSKTWRDPWGER